MLFRFKFVRTNEARTKIRSWFKKERREENIEQGKGELEREFRRNLINIPEESMEEFLLAQAKRQRLNTVDDFYAAVGYGGISLSRLMPRIKEEFLKKYRAEDEEREREKKALEAANKAKKPAKPTSGVIVEGVGSCLVKFAKCCNPLPGDPIIGFITRGYGVSIHKMDCTNVVNAPEESKGRWIHAEWANTIREKFKSTVEVLATSRETLLADVSITLSNMHIPIHSLIAKELKDKEAIIQLTVEVNDLDQLQLLMNSLNNIRGVTNVQRLVQ